MRLLDDVYFPATLSVFLERTTIAHKPVAIEEQTLPGLLARQAEIHSARPFVIDRGAAVTYAALDDESRRVAAGLRKLGVKAGDRVAVWLPNGSAWLASFFGCLRLGVIVVALNTRFRSAEIADVLKRSGTRVLIFQPRFGDVDLQKTLADVEPESLTHLETIIVRNEHPSSPPQVFSGKNARTYDDLVRTAPLKEDFGAPGDRCIIFTTSGTTRLPKFVLHSHASLLRHARAVSSHYGLETPGSTLLMTLPFAGIFGFCQATAALVAGATMVTSPIFDAEESIRSIAAHRVTHMVAADIAIDRLLAAASEPGAFATVRFCVYATFTPSLADIGSRADAQGLKLVGVYGSSEVQALLSRQLETATLEERTEKGGWPVSPETRVRTRDTETGRLLGHGEHGELEIQAPSLMVGYFEDPEAFEKAITEDGYFRTGDLGYTCGDGRFVYLARLGDSLRLGGFLVSPAEIEAVIQEHASVKECQIVGVETHGEWRAFAFVIEEPGHHVDQAEIISYCKRRLSGSKVPVRVQQIDAFPVTESANSTKIQKGKLRKLAQDVLGHSE